MMKAWITALGAEYALTHSLDRLEDILAAEGEPLTPLGFDLLLLEPYAVQFRYHLGASISGDTRVKIQTAVRLLRKYAFCRILELERA